MHHLTQLLQEADPLRHEEGRADARLERVRAVVLAAARERPAQHRRPVLAAAGAMLALAVAVWLGVYAASPWTPSLAAQVRFEVRLAEAQPAPGLVAAEVASTRRMVYLHPEAIVGNDDIAGATVIDGAAAGAFGVEVSLATDGAERLKRATSAHLGRPVALVLDGRVMMAPTVRSPIGDSAIISGPFTEDEARRIAEGISRR